MFYCEKCRKENHWPESLALSYGLCEVCHQTRKCYDYPSKYLYVKEKEKCQRS